MFGAREGDAVVIFRRGPGGEVCGIASCPHETYTVAGGDADQLSGVPDGLYLAAVQVRVRAGEAEFLQHRFGGEIWYRSLRELPRLLHRHGWGPGQDIQIVAMLE